jgi:hypothetical protein
MDLREIDCEFVNCSGMVKGVGLGVGVDFGS